MSDARFLQIHTLTSYPATLLNRDDAGFAKRLPFGGATRTRISSQCLKYHWRHNDGEHALYNLDVGRSYRSRQTFLKKVATPLVEEGYPTPLVRAAVYTIKELLLSDKVPKPKDLSAVLNPAADSNPDEPILTNQVTVFGEPEVAHLRQVARDLLEGLKERLGPRWNDQDSDFSKDDADSVHGVVKDLCKKEMKKNLQGLRVASGLDAAMFGRMTTSDVLARGDAAVHVAHAFTTHKQASESDYFSAVDELSAEDDQLGAGLIHSSELTSGLFYSYVVIDIPLLVSNIEGCDRESWHDEDRSLAAEVVERFIQLIATTFPGAKLGSTAPYAWADMVLVEAGSEQPRTLANAFRRAVSEEPDVLENSYQALGRYVSDLDRMYSTQSSRQLAARGPIEGLLDAVGVESAVSVADAAKWAAALVRG